MKNFHQNLLIVLALSLCGLCVFQWYNQTAQRKEIQNQNQLIFKQATDIQAYTNSISDLDHQVADLDARIAELKATVKTNELTMRDQQREISRLDLANSSLTNEVAQYKKNTEILQSKLNEAFEMEKKLDDSIKKVVEQRDDVVKKLNESVTDRNSVVEKYNELVTRFEKLQSSAKESSK